MADEYAEPYRAHDMQREQELLPRLHRQMAEALAAALEFSAGDEHGANVDTSHERAERDGDEDHREEGEQRQRCERHRRGADHAHRPGEATADTIHEEQKDECEYEERPEPQVGGVSLSGESLIDAISRVFAHLLLRLPELPAAHAKSQHGGDETHVNHRARKKAHEQ